MDSIQKLSFDSANAGSILTKALITLGEEYPIFPDSHTAVELRFENRGEGDTAIVWDGQKVLVRYTALSAALRAVGAVLSGMSQSTVEHKSRFDTFGIMLDCSRNAVMNIAHVKKWLRRLALLGYNMAMLYTEDTYEIDDFPYFGYLRGAYTLDEIKELDDYANALGIELIACIQTLGHLEQILKWSDFKKVSDTHSVLLVDEEKTYALINKMLSFWKEGLRSTRIHIGMDETHDLGRGRFLDKNGYERPFDIFNRHLARVCDLCKEYDLKPMIWSDMYFRMGSKSGDYYDKDCLIPEDVKNAIPKEAELVYWDYYHENKDFYLDWFHRHRSLDHEPIMASGVQTWKQLWYNREICESNAGACIDASKETGVKELFFTMWGDDGSYCDFDSALAGLAWCAEKSFADKVDHAVLSQRFAGICGASYDDICKASSIQTIYDAQSILWDDPLLGIHLQHLRTADKNKFEAAEGYFTDLAAQFGQLAQTDSGQAGSLKHAHLLVELLKQKCGISKRLIAAYSAKDSDALKSLQVEIETIQHSIEAVSQSFRRIWLYKNKIFGLEVLQIRMAGQKSRFVELSTRIQEFLDGQIESIPELDANLPTAPGSHNTLSGNYNRIATASNIL